MTEDWRRCVIDPALRVLVELDLPLKDRKSLSPLSRAVLLGTPVMELKKYREDADETDDQGRTAVRYAVEMGSLETTKELLDNIGVNPDLPDLCGITPLHVACNRGDSEIVDALLRKVKLPSVVDNKGETALIAACRAMNWELVSRLAKIGVAVADSSGRTALHWIMMNTTSITECMEAFECLLSNEANINAQDSRGRAPLHVAAERGLSDACLLLAKRGARLNITDNQGETPLHRCVMRPALLQGKNSVLQTLLELKADVSIKRLDGKTADDVVAILLTERTWTESQRVALEVGHRRLKKAMEDMQKV